jgi:hypothetical protein
MYSAANSATGRTEGKLITELTAVRDLTVKNDKICEKIMA